VSLGIPSPLSEASAERLFFWCAAVAESPFGCLVQSICHRKEKSKVRAKVEAGKKKLAKKTSLGAKIFVSSLDSTPLLAVRPPI
jgi:hypothetical protein